MIVFGLAGKQGRPAWCAQGDVYEAIGESNSMLGKERMHFRHMGHRACVLVIGDDDHEVRFGGGCIGTRKKEKEWNGHASWSSHNPHERSPHCFQHPRQLAHDLVGARPRSIESPVSRSADYGL